MTRSLPSRARRAVALLGAAALLPLTLLTTSAPAQAACATRTTKSISGTVYGQDGRDVNVSVGFDVVDGLGRAINVDPASPGYGCPKTGAYSIPQKYFNHFVTYQGAPQGSLMKDGTRTTRAWKVSNLPSNASTVWIEAYSRGYAGSPCRDSVGNYCFNPGDTRKYGYANKIKVPVGTQGVKVVLPLTCAFGGTTGSIVGTGVDAAGNPVPLKQVYAWTEHAWNTAPGIHGWGGHKPTTAKYDVRSLAGNQRYVIWAYTTNGKKHVRKGVLVQPCKATPLRLPAT